jgi:hypothetical protein
MKAAIAVAPIARQVHGWHIESCQNLVALYDRVKARIDELARRGPPIRRSPESVMKHYPSLEGVPSLGALIPPQGLNDAYGASMVKRIIFPSAPHLKYDALEVRCGSSALMLAQPHDTPDFFESKPFDDEGLQFVVNYLEAMKQRDAARWDAHQGRFEPENVSARIAWLIENAGQISQRPRKE